MKITDCISTLNPAKYPSRAISALHTTRGAAFCDVMKLKEAKMCANIALKFVSESYHTHYLLGRIFFAEGNFPEGERHFDAAGASKADIEREKQKALSRRKMH